MTIDRAPRVAVAVMAKAPVPGEAKTRLGVTIGHLNASTLYRAFLFDTIEVVDNAAPRLGIQWKLLVCPDERHATLLRQAVNPAWSVVTQKRFGLMGGIVDAFDAAFAHGADVTLVTDADSPLSLHEHVDRCVGLSARHDISLGPTDDGGYYLVSSRRGARASLSSLFLGTTFESSTICSMTAGRARSLSLTVGMGPTGLDVDTEDDLQALTSRLTSYPTHVLPRTREALATFDSMFATWSPTS